MLSEGIRSRCKGKERDSESGLDNFGARYNSSSLGRFMSPDPLLSSGLPANPQSWNKYAYALNNPLRILDPTGLYDWDESAGGNFTDDELQMIAGGANRKRRKWAQNALNFREQFRNALDAADEAAGSSALSDDQQSSAQAGVDAYGTEGDSNGVTVGYRGGGSPGTTDPSNHVTFNIDKHGKELAVIVAHEGVHINDNTLANFGFPITHADSERAAWNVSSHLAQAFGFGHYPSGAVDNLENVQVWNKGWKQADRETYRSKGVANLLNEYYQGEEKHYLETTFP